MGLDRKPAKNSIANDRLSWGPGLDAQQEQGLASQSKASHHGQKIIGNKINVKKKKKAVWASMCITIILTAKKLLSSKIPF